MSVSDCFMSVSDCGPFFHSTSSRLKISYLMPSRHLDLERRLTKRHITPTKRVKRITVQKKTNKTNMGNAHKTGSLKVHRMVDWSESKGTGSDYTWCVTINGARQIQPISTPDQRSA